MFDEITLETGREVSGLFSGLHILKRAKPADAIVYIHVCMLIRAYVHTYILCVCEKATLTLYSAFSGLLNSAPCYFEKKTFSAHTSRTRGEYFALKKILFFLRKINTTRVYHSRTSDT